MSLTEKIEAVARRIYGATLQNCVNVYAPISKLRATYYALVELVVNRRYKTFGKNLVKIFKKTK